MLVPEASRRHARPHPHPKARQAAISLAMAAAPGSAAREFFDEQVGLGVILGVPLGYRGALDWVRGF